MLCMVVLDKVIIVENSELFTPWRKVINTVYPSIVSLVASYRKQSLHDNYKQVG